MMKMRLFTSAAKDAPHSQTKRTDGLRWEESFPGSPQSFLLPAGYGLQLLFGGTQGDYANPGLNVCVSASVLFPRCYFFFVPGVEASSFCPSLVRISRGCDSALVGDNLSQRQATEAPHLCRAPRELPRNHDLTFSPRRHG